MHLRLAIDLSSGLELLAIVKENGPDDDGVRAHDLLMVIDVRRAVWAVVCT